MSSKRSSASRRDRPHLLLTGCYGGLGSHLAHRLFDDGWRIDGIDRAQAVRRPLPRGMKVHRIDLAASANLASLVARYDGVLHLAGISRVGDAEQRPLDAIRANILGTANLLESIRLAKRRPWLLFASSLEVKTNARGAYGLTNMYGLTKAVSELLGQRYAADYGMVVAAARIAGIYGNPTDHPDKVPLIFARRALKGEPIRVASGQRLMDYIHVDDVTALLASGMQQLMELRPPAFCVLDVRSARRVGLPRLARMMRRSANADVPIISFQPPLPADCVARKLKLPAPQVSLEAGFTQLIAALRNGHV